MKKDKREKRNKIIISIIIAVVMVSSIIGFLYGTNVSENEMKYDINNKTYSFVRQNNMYILNLNKQKIGFYYLPFEIDLNISDEISNKIKNSGVIYITFNPEMNNPEYIDVARFDLATNFAMKNIYTINGITNENVNYNLPIINCENATNFIPVIIMQESNTTNVNMTNNCITMQGKNFDFIKFRDLIIYKLYGVL